MCKILSATPYPLKDFIAKIIAPDIGHVNAQNAKIMHD